MDRPNYEVNILGDVNINLNKSRDPSVKKYKDFLRRNYLRNMVHHDTHFDHRDMGSCIDHFVTSDPELYQQSGICLIDVSDHYIIYGARKKFKIHKDNLK